MELKAFSKSRRKTAAVRIPEPVETVISVEQLRIPPNLCMIRPDHNRDISTMNEVMNADLITSMRTEGRQIIPAIGRRVEGVAGILYQVVAGLRRWWTVTYLRDHGMPELLFLIEIRDLNDEAAFRLADLENRSRLDLTDLERGLDYKRALPLYYSGHQGVMSKAIGISQTALSRYLTLARLSTAAVGAFDRPQALGISHAAILGPMLKKTGDEVVEARAMAVQEVQAARRDAGQEPLSCAEVVRRLCGRNVDAGEQPSTAEVTDETGQVVARARIGKSGDIHILCPGGQARSPEQLVQACSSILQRMRGPEA